MMERRSQSREMKGSNIDQSFFERKKLQTLIDRASMDRISPEELEAIGISIRETGRRGAEQIVRRLWSERRAEAIRRYTYLLDFFEDDEGWIDELIEIAMTRRDLDEEGKNALLQALEELGIDTRALPLENIPPLGSISAREVMGPILDAGFRGVVRVITDIFALDPEFRTGVIDEIATVDDPRIADLLFTLTAIDDPDISSAAVQGLSQVKTPHARGLLRELASFVPDPHLQRMAEKGGRRLAFLGVPEPEKGSDTPPVIRAWGGCPDNNGNLDILLTFDKGRRTSTLLFMQIHEENGMMAAMVDADLSPERLREKWTEFRIGSEILPVSKTFALELIRDAIARNREQDMFLPPEYYALRWELRGEDSPFERRIPPTPDPVRRRRFWPFTGVRSILEHPFFGVMLELSEPTYTIAEEWIKKEKESGGMMSPKDVESLVDRLIDQVLVPKMDRLPRRLRLAAEILDSGGRHELLARTARAEAAALETADGNPHRSPFIRRLAFESLLAAREGLLEGYDPRGGEGELDWW